MTLQTCPRCGAHNAASAVACLTCGGAFGGSSAATGPSPAPGLTVSPSVATAPPPVATGLPPAPPRRADMAFDRPWTSSSPGLSATPAPQPSRTSPLLAGIVAAVVALAVGGWFMLRSDGGLPGSIAGMGRLDSAEAKAFEEQAAATEFAGITFRGAMYGTAGTPELIVELIDGVPDGAPVGSLDEMFDSMGDGFASGSGGSVTLTAKAKQTIAGVDYICAPFHAADPTTGSIAGSVCLWHGDGYGLVATLRTDDASTAIADAQLVYDAAH
jgi:hypothetical protein